MKIKVLNIGVLALLVAIAAAGLVFLHGQNARIRTQIAALPPRHGATEKLRAENAQVRSLLQRAQGSEGDAARVIHEELVRAREQTAELERHAELRRAQIAAQAANDADSLASNHDPRRGLVRLENFQDAGQATPGATFQTIVWAALKGDDALLARLLLLSAPARASAEALIATLPAQERGKWTPEKLAALSITGAVTDISAAAISSETMDDAEHATLDLRIPGVDAAKSKLSLQLGVAGWRAVVPPAQIETLRRKLEGVVLPSAKK